DGSYQFFGRETGRYTISIDSPPGYEPSTSCTVTGESFDPTGGEDPTSLGSGEDGNTGVLVEPDCAANTFYLAFDLERGDPFVINNNLPFKEIANPVPPPPLVPGNACEVLLINEGFEAPALNSTFPVPHQIFQPSRIAAYRENDVPGWFVSGNDFIELWRNGNTASGGVPAYEDEQFAEINAYVDGSLYQDVITTPGSIITWQFAHRGRTGVDTMNLMIGSPGATIAQINPTNGTTSFSTDNSDWVVYEGTYTVPPGQSITRFEYESVNTASGSSSVGNFIDSLRVGLLCDHGDAGSNYPVLRNNNGAAHINDGVTFLGNSVKIELDGQPSTAANGDDGVPNDADNIDDEDGVTFVSQLDTGTATSVDVVASVPGYLNAWIDFNHNESWNDPGEQVFTDEPLEAGTNNLNFAVPIDANIGVTAARFRFSSGGGFGATGIVGDGEVEDYQITVTASDPSLLLVKRITAINRDRLGEIIFDSFVNDNTEDDNNSSWLGFQASSNSSGNTNTYTLGEIDGGEVKPGDEVEYTIYFLSAGGKAAANVLVCDLIPDNMEFITTGFESEPAATTGLLGTAKGLLWEYNSEVESLSNAIDGDGGSYFPPGAEPINVFPTVRCGNPSQPNTNGAIVIDLGSLPNATAPGTPSNSYGFIRFRAVVK
ncbi:MAG: GEVED domain-containing protein, partial [Cyanobacteria bacterium J06588_4]